MWSYGIGNLDRRDAEGVVEFDLFIVTGPGECPTGGPSRLSVEFLSNPARVATYGICFPTPNAL